MHKKTVYYNQSEINGRLIDGELWAPVSKIADLLGFNCESTPIGAKITDRACGVHTPWGTFRGVLHGSNITASPQTILMAAGCKVERHGDYLLVSERSF